MSLPKLGATALLIAAFVATAATQSSPQKMLAAGRVDEAITALQQRVSASSTDAEANHWLGRAYYSLEDWDHAIQYGEKAVELSPNQSTYHMWLARAYGEKADSASFLSAPGWAKKARVAWERAVQIDPSSVEARTDLAEFYFEAPGIVGGGKDKARAQADALMKLAPEKAHWVYARIAEKDKDSATAENEYKAAQAATKAEAEGWMYLASFYRNAGRLPDMESAIQKAASAPSKDCDPWIGAASTLLRTGRNFPLAIDLAKRCLAPDKGSEDIPAFKVHTLLGKLYEKQGDKNAAANEYRAALVTAKDFKPAQEGLKRTSR
jgi:tetratricopeptide (TPR) repeat protein